MILYFIHILIDIDFLLIVTFVYSFHYLYIYISINIEDKIRYIYNFIILFIGDLNIISLYIYMLFINKEKFDREIIANASARSPRLAGFLIIGVCNYGYLDT